ncbi:PPR domain protein [Medicago truncatula]|uniref:PPR domain protein n=1 Tax=Medicago truncatula TaxID=3880 RepID=G7K064_MEDTR|nr:PPR domain protein [Medicago truncatula]
MLNIVCIPNLGPGCNTLMDMYMQCESVTDAKRLFDEIPEKDIASWTLDGVILTNVLSKCASLGLLDYGRCVHEYIYLNIFQRAIYYFKDENFLYEFSL